MDDFTDFNDAKIENQGQTETKNVDFGGFGEFGQIPQSENQTQKVNKEFGDFDGFNNQQKNPPVTDTPKEDFGDFEGFEQANVQNQKQDLFEKDIQFDFGGPKQEEQPKSATINWGFNPEQQTQTQILPNKGNFDFDFNQPQTAATNNHKTTTQGAEDFDDFQFETAPPNPSEIHPKVEDSAKQNENADFDFGNFQGTITHQANATAFDFEPKDSSVKESPEQVIGKDAKSLWDDFDQVIPKADNQSAVNTQNGNGPENDGDFGGFEEGAREEKQQAEKQNMDWDFGGFEQSKKEEEQIEQSPALQENENEDFGDFEGGAEQQPVEPKLEKDDEDNLEEDEQPKERRDNKRMTVFDIDFTEFGIEEKPQGELPPMEFNFGVGVNEEKQTPTEPQSGKGLGSSILTTIINLFIGDLYSLYGNAQAITEVKETQEQEEDLFGDMQGGVKVHQASAQELEDIFSPSIPCSIELFLTNF